MLELHELLRTWAAAFLMLISVGWTIYWSLTISRKAAVKAEQDRLADELAKLKNAISTDEKADSAQFTEVKSRLQKVEEDIKHLPTKEQVHSLELTMRDMNGSMQALRTEIRPLSASVERIDNFLMRQATPL